MRIFFVIIFFSVLVSSSDSYSKNKISAKSAKNISAVTESANSCKTMGDNLYNCTPFECDTSLPGDASKKVHNKIVGLNKDGDCVSEQSNAGGDKVTCRYSDESRKFLALRMKKAHTDLANMPETSDMEENILADIFHNECDVISANADDKPVVTEDDEAAMEDDEDESTPQDGNNAEGKSSQDDQIPDAADDNVDAKKVKDNGDLLDSKD
jgi:hypothetical protein